MDILDTRSFNQKVESLIKIQVEQHLKFLGISDSRLIRNFASQMEQALAQKLVDGLFEIPETKRMIAGWTRNR